ncbi:hypothetical protein [Kribbella antiqua]|uniref:hypothetical protein n=1 Tax=Kribbella antiqua TaxID=2512217 RepID=UPI0010525717|nr:hypothetical protein [Kribbella antiqua]
MPISESLTDKGFSARKLSAGVSIVFCMELLDERPVWSMSGAEMLTALDALQAELTRIQVRRLELLAGLDANGHAKDIGARDTVHLLSMRHRLDPVDARRDLRLATAPQPANPAPPRRAPGPALNRAHHTILPAKPVRFPQPFTSMRGGGASSPRPSAVPAPSTSATGFDAWRNCQARPAHPGQRASVPVALCADEMKPARSLDARIPSVIN